ncbi:MAG TPA: phosphoenolpyruvate-utilizing N-terminal domain-containing protein, partial [Isosphaeraceae bacterium]
MSTTGAAHQASLLLTLEEISQLVSHSHDPGETLANIVRLIQGRFHTDVCSVYVLAADRGALVLGATVGLEPASVGRVRMQLDEGLTGLVAETMAPVMVDDAFRHPRFKYFPEAGEDPYHSFLGVPMIEAGAVQGVLVVQTTEPRAFTADEARMLVAVAAQLAPLVGGARLLERVAAAERAPAPAAPAGNAAGSLRGTPLGPGVGVGRAEVVDGMVDWPGPPESGTADPAEQGRRLAAALDAARQEILRLGRRICAMVGEDHGAILQAQLMILQDRKVERDLAGRLAAGDRAEEALGRTLDTYVAAFQGLSNP